MTNLFLKNKNWVSVLNDINDFERAFGVEEWKIDGLAIWPLIRYPLLVEWGPSTSEITNITKKRIRFFIRINFSDKLLHFVGVCARLVFARLRFLIK